MDKMVSSLNSITAGFSLSGSHNYTVFLCSDTEATVFLAASFCAATVQG